MKLALGEGQMTSKRAIASYTFDYAVIIILIIASVELDRVEPFHQQFSLRNYTLQYTFRPHDRVPRALLWTVGIISPAIIIAIWTLLIDGIFSHRVDGLKRKHTFRQRLWQLNAGLLGLGLAISLQYVIVNTLKNVVGKPRPDLIDRCQPVAGAEDPEPFGLSNYTICTQTTHSILKDGFRSFPSGHSATSFGGLFYLSLFLSGKLHIFDSRGEVWKIFVVLIPSLGAALVAATRIMDARHHPFDVLSGSLIGLLVAWLSYRQYYPSPRDFRKKGNAYPMRTWTANEALGAREDTEEEGEDGEQYGYTATDRDEEDVHPEASSSGIVGGNTFRDEISRSQRQRQSTAQFNPISSGDEPDLLPVISAPGQQSNRANPTPLRRPESGSRLTSWEAVSGPTTDDESGRQSKTSMTYDPVLEDTSYRGAGAGKGLGVTVQQSEVEAQ